MPKKNGFISISIIYSFFLAFTLLLVLIMATYTNNRYNFNTYKNYIKARFIAKAEELSTFNVSFDTNGGGIIEDQMIEQFGTVTKPEDPEKLGYSFIGWYLNDQEYDFNSKVTSNMTLLAIYEEINVNDDPPRITSFSVESTITGYNSVKYKANITTSEPINSICLYPQISTVTTIPDASMFTCFGINSIYVDYVENSYTVSGDQIVINEQEASGKLYNIYSYVKNELKSDIKTAEYQLQTSCKNIPKNQRQITGWEYYGMNGPNQVGYCLYTDKISGIACRSSFTLQVACLANNFR